MDKRKEREGEGGGKRVKEKRDENVRNNLVLELLHVYTRPILWQQIYLCTMFLQQVAVHTYSNICMLLLSKSKSGFLRITVDP